MPQSFQEPPEAWYCNSMASGLVSLMLASRTWTLPSRAALVKENEMVPSALLRAASGTSTQLLALTPSMV